MPTATIQDAIKQAAARDLAEAHYNRRKARERASERLDEASIANYRAAASWLQTLERRVAKRRRTLG